MKPDKIWAHCLRCGSTQRFVRAPTNHRLHGMLTVLTLGLWGVSWLAIVIWHRVWPWQCKNCGFNEPDLENAKSKTERRFDATFR
jgi:hypothetical protein